MLEILSRFVKRKIDNHKFLACLFITAVVFSVIGACLAWHIKRPGADVRAYASMRMVAIQSHLDNQAGPYILLAGDSQAELQSPAGKICGEDVVNAGISGSGALLYSNLFRSLKFTRQPDMVVLSIGTNDLVLSRNPSSQKARSRFEGTMEALLALMPAPTDKIVLTAIPPIGKSLGDKLDISSVSSYSAIIENICVRERCFYIDAYADSRTSDFGIAKDGAMRDELHMANYKQINDRINELVCHRSAR